MKHMDLKNWRVKLGKFNQSFVPYGTYMTVAIKAIYAFVWFVDMHFSEYKKHNKYDYNEKPD